MLKVDSLLRGEFPAASAAECFALISEHYAVNEERWLAELMRLADPGPAAREAIGQQALELIEAARAQPQRPALEALLQEYRLDTQEGLVLMCLAEALLRVPDRATADALIRDRLSSADWQRHLGSDNLLVNFASWGLLLTGRLIEPTRLDGPGQSILSRLLQRSGEPVIRAALNQAMRLMGEHFVLGRDMPQALRRARAQGAEGYAHSFDMLGEAALSAEDAAQYLARYRQAIDALAAQAPQEGLRPSVSIKLSALHPRYEMAQRQRVFDELLPRLLELARHARQQGVAMSIDAEEADRLELSLQLFEQLLRDPQLAGWGELGLVLQAYSKRSLPVLVWLTLLGRELGARMPLRLVKGAYWDSEIKQAQVQGLSGYPLFTRKQGTDVAYLACARYLLSEPCRGVFYPQFASHNAHTLSSILHLATALPPGAFELQRLHGMGEALYAGLMQRYACPVRIYAPVGAHRELLPYLVRRLLENGANSSFVRQLLDPRVAPQTLAEHPLQRLRDFSSLANLLIPLPTDILRPRQNSQGLNLNILSQWQPLAAAYYPQLTRQWQATPVIDGERLQGRPQTRRCPYARSEVIGQVQQASVAQVQQALARLSDAWPAWNATPVDTRAGVLERLADLLQQHRAELMALCTREAGKTLQDGLDEVREAVDFCRYYAQQARRQLRREELPGPTGERNELFYEGRGVIACISPWNFPLAIFIGQISAALVAGNCVLAKPAEQNSLIAARVLPLLIEAGLPPAVIALLPGDGAELGAAICSDARLAGVCFTGSGDTARAINRQLAARDGALACLIAETGGQNAMLVDSTALPEQVVRDVLSAAFGSAGQRCSALRVLYVQRDIAERVIELLKGAMAELTVGDPSQRATDLGPLIDEAALRQLQAHVSRLKDEGRLLAESPLPADLDGWFLPPVAFEIEGIQQLQEEHFGPVLHVVRYAAQELDAVLAAIHASGYGLTLGVHSRNEATVARIEALARVGNLYVNRNQIGAVVGVQPFGGSGLSGTGPKAGGPNYLLRLSQERCSSRNTAAVGGNVHLLSGD